jgi:hypothetical protein
MYAVFLFSRRILAIEGNEQPQARCPCETGLLVEHQASAETMPFQWVRHGHALEADWYAFKWQPLRGGLWS